MSEPAHPDPSQPSPYYVPPDYQTSLPEERSGRPRWVLALIIGGAVALLCMCIAIPAAAIGLFTIGLPVTEVFPDFEQEEWTSDSDSDIISSTDIVAADTTSALAAGQTAELTNLSITITDTRQVLKIEDMMEPLFDHQYWIVEAELVNTNADTSLSIEPYDTWVQDVQGNIYEYYWEAALSAEATMLRRPLPPGQSVTGTFVYEIPSTVDALFWVYTDPVSGEQVVFAIP